MRLSAGKSKICWGSLDHTAELIGNEIEIQKIHPESVPVHKLCDRAVQRIRLFQKRAGYSKEAEDLKNERMESRVQNVSSLGKKFVEAHAIVF
jgi:hypothetical protein